MDLSNVYMAICHYVFGDSFSSRNFNYSNVGWRTLPLFHYSIMHLYYIKQGFSVKAKSYWCTITTSNITTSIDCNRL